MLKIGMIIPYYGKFPSYFDLVLKSMSNQQNFYFIFFTDRKIEDVYKLPPNVIYYYLSFDELVKFVKSKFRDLKIQLRYPYKLCDFKPAYGYIFNEFLKEYDWWGYCDIDVIFGDLNKFITVEILNEYTKVLCRGHLTIYRNIEEVNNYFRLYHPSMSYKDVFSDKKQ